MISTVPHRARFSYFPLAFLAASFAVGIAFVHSSGIGLAQALTLGTIGSSIAILSFRRRKPSVATVSLLFSFACLGSLFSLVERRSVGETRVKALYDRGVVASGDAVEVTGVLERAPESAPDGLQMLLLVEKLLVRDREIYATGRVELFAPARDEATRNSYVALELRRGARIRVMLALSRRDTFRNPGVTSLTEILDRRDIDARGTVKSPLLIDRLDDEPVFLPLVFLEKLRASMTRVFDETFSPDTAGVIKATLLGNRQGLSHATAERYREGGTFHVLVISGMHITFIAGAVWFIAAWFTPSAVRQWLIAAAAAWTYAAFAGGEASVVRAALMFTFVALGPVLGRHATSLNALGGAGLILLALRPANLYDPSFQLTFLSVFAIVGLATPILARMKAIGEWRPTRSTPHPPCCPIFFRRLSEVLFWTERRWRRDLDRSSHSYGLFKSPLAVRIDHWRIQPFLRYLFAATLVSIIVQLTLLPLLVIYFHRLSFAAPVLNIFVGVLMVLLSLAALSAAALSAVGLTTPEMLVRLTEAISWFMAHGVDPFEARGVASIRIPEYTGCAASLYAIYFVSIATLACQIDRWKPAQLGWATGVVGSRIPLRSTSVVYVMLLTTVLVHPLSAGRADKGLRIDFLDVGQGDSAFITFPDGTTLVVDGGGRPRFFDKRDEIASSFERDSRSIGEAVVSEYLWWRGLDRIDYVLATHADADHIDGLNDVLRNFNVGAALVARAPRRDLEFERFAATAQRTGTELYVIGRGDALRFGSATLEVLWPPNAKDSPARSWGNDDSIVLRIRYGSRSFVFTGDIEKRAESRLTGFESPGCDVVKVAHHGSRTSSTDGFVSATRARLAIVSVGIESPYGHPHTEVLERWRAAGAEVMTTGERGTITISTDGSELDVKTFAAPRR
jgi:competence protein ComEC